MATAIAPVLPLSAEGTGIQDGYSWTMEDGGFYSGSINLYTSGKEGDNLTVRVDGQEISPSDKVPEIRLLYEGGDGNPDRDIKTDSSYGAANVVSLNGTRVGKFPSDGSVGVVMGADGFVNGENSVTVLIGGYWGGGPYDESKPHGIATQGNKDDFLLHNVRFRLPNGQEVTPSKLVTYKAKAVGSTEKVIETFDPYPYAPSEEFWLCDGWGNYDTYAGHKDPRYNIPYKVDFVLDYEKPGSEAMFELDTSAYASGKHTVELYAGSSRVALSEVTFDNEDPVITTNLSDYDTVTNGFQLKVSITDATSGVASSAVRLEGKTVSTETSFTYELQDLQNGVQSLVFEVEDRAGNKVFKNLYFNAGDETVPKYSDMKTENGSLSLQVGAAAATVSFYEADALDYTASYGSVASVDTMGEKPESEQAFPEWYAYQMANGGEAVETTSASGMPYHAFDIDVGDATGGQVSLSYEGSTIENERLALKAYNYSENAWVTLDVGTGSSVLSAVVDVAEYAKDGKIRAMAVVANVGNGSSTMIWSTDPQHYTVFEDLNPFYEKVYEYIGEEYLAGRAAYSITTGDIVDDSPVQSSAEKQWQIADKAISLMEKTGMPNGTVTGNHDTGNYPSAIYTLYNKYFGADRYRSEAWFGGSLNDNSSHYDLITIGNIDFVILHLGYGVEGTPETIAWANDVLQRYSHRNAIITTHSYLKATTGAWDASSRAEVIYNQIVVPNENVKMLLCGHDNGAVTLKKQIGEDRVFYEILSDYQFVELEDPEFYGGNAHVIGVTSGCNGDGYIRSMTFNGDKVETKTFSPVTGGTNPFGIRDEFTISVDFQQADRVITTKNFSATILGDKIADVDAAAGSVAATDYSGDADAWAAVITTDEGSVVTASQKLRVSAAPDKPDGALEAADLSALRDLVAEGQSLKAGDYMADSFESFTGVLEKAAGVAAKENPSAEEVSETYKELFTALRGLEAKKEGSLDPADLQSLNVLEMDKDKWQNLEGPTSFDDPGSYLDVTSNADGSLTFEKNADNSPNNWPSTVYSEKITITPVDGKVYLNLDIDASSAWSFYPIVTQGSKTGDLRWNYILEGLADNTADAGPGTFKGVFDVTQVFEDMGFDLTKPLTIRISINAVPGPLTIRRIEFMTNKGPVDTSALQGKVDEAKALNPADYTADSWSAVQKALADAEEILNNGDATESQVEDALEALTSAISGLIPVNSTDPTDPTDPVNPTNPTDPTDPTDSTDSSEPTSSTGNGGDASQSGGTAGAGSSAPNTGEDSSWLFLVVGLAVIGASLLVLTAKKAKG